MLLGSKWNSFLITFFLLWTARLLSHVRHSSSRRSNGSFLFGYSTLVFSEVGSFVLFSMASLSRNSGSFASVGFMK